MQQVTEQHCGIGSSLPGKAVVCIFRQCILFFYPNAENIPQSAGIAAHSYQIVVVHVTAEESSHETAACFDKLSDPFVMARFYHV